jgi:hypothetical protein
MKLTLPRIPHPSWPRRNRAPEPAAAADLTGVLRAFRTAALWAIGVLTAMADGAAFTESYRGLFEWAEHHNLAGFWAAAFPAQIDTFIVIGELVLFVAMVGRWNWRDRASAWAVALLGLAVSVAGNVGHVAAHDLQSRGTAAVPPLAAFGALWLGLGVLKRIVRNGARPGDGGAETAQDAAPGGHLAATLDSLAEAVRSLAARADGASPAADGRADETALLAELLEAVRDVGARISGTVSVPVPVGAEDAALIAYRATVAAGNPYSMNALAARFGLTRAQVARIRKATEDEPGGPPLAGLNGHQLEPAGAEASSN